MHRLPNLRLPALRLPSFRIPALRRPSLRLRPEIDLDDPRRFTEPLQFFFYLLIFVALLAILTGATGTGILMLIAGATVHVARSSLEEVAAQRQARRERGERKRQVRLRSHRATRKEREAPARPAPKPPAKPAPKLEPAAPEIRVSAAPRAAPRRRPVPAQSRASSARKQRVI